MAAETQYTAKTGMVKLVTANSTLTGSSGTLYTVITGGTNGTLIKSITIKATGTGVYSTYEGMVRLFVHDGTSATRLFMEIKIPPVGQSSTEPTFETTIQLDYVLASNYVIKATTQTGDLFNVIAEGLDFAYYASSVRPESTNYTANTGTTLTVLGNTSLTGSGTDASTIFTVITAQASGSGWLGLCIDSISIKAAAAVTNGMVRIFVQNNTGTGADNTFLLTEICIPNIIPSATSKSFGHKILFPNKFQLQAGFKILVTTENTASFAVIADAMDWKYPA